MKKNETTAAGNQLQLLLNNLLDDKAVQSHKIDEKLIATFSYEDKAKEEVSIPLKEIFFFKNFRELSIDTETLDKYAFKFKTLSITFNQNHELKHNAHAYAAYYYSEHGSRMNTMIRTNQFELTLA